jgi:sulfate permease, SulP family
VTSPPLLPGLASLRGYQRSWLRGDVVAGVTVAAYAVPQVMAYAELAGLPAVVGLYAILVPLVRVRTCSGRRASCRWDRSRPRHCSPLLPSRPSLPATRSAMRRWPGCCALLVAGYCVVAWGLRLGFVADLLSRDQCWSDT